MTRVAAFLGLVSACSAPLPSHTGLGGQVAARVGDLDIPAAAVAEVANDRRVSPSAAVTLLVDDAIAAKAAVAEHLDRSDDVLFGTLAATARATVDRVRADASKTLPTDDEVKKLSKKHWIEVDSPATMLVVHAVALRPKKPDANAEAAARDVAAAIASAVAGATDADDFQAKAKAVPHGDVEVVVQPLEPFTADGRVAVSGYAGGFDAAFVKAADTLRTPGATSGVVESPFGWHVIRLIERHPPRFVAFEDRRKLFATEVYALRAHDAVEAIEASRRSRSGVSMVDGVDEVLAGALPAVLTEAAPTR